MVDSAEMLALLPDGENICKIEGAFPKIDGFVARYAGSFDVILCYSVFQYIFVEFPIFQFLDCALNLLAPGGQMLIGDIPNVTRRKRFFASDSGRNFHKDFMKTDEDPVVEFNRIEFDKIDDSVMLSLVQRARLQGFDAFILPQKPDLPMANRREDIFIVRP